MSRFTPRRAWVAAAVVALLLLGVAVTAATVLEPRTRDFDRFQGLSIWKIDVHERIDPEVLGHAVGFARSQEILGIVNLGGSHFGGGLERHLEAAARFPGRVLVFMEVDERDCCDESWVERESIRLVEGRAAGARGVHLPRALLRGDGTPVPLDADSIDPLWRIVEGLALPVVLRPGSGPEDRRELEALLSRNPGIPFLSLGMAGLASDLPALASLLDTHPNLQVDVAGALPALSRDPDRAREFLTRYGDRVLLGTDLRWFQGPRPEQRTVSIGEDAPVRGPEARLRYLDSIWRFLESREKGIPGPVPGDPPMQGLGLPPELLRRLYQGNARALCGFGDLEALR